MANRLETDSLEELARKSRDALHGFLDRTLSSSDSVKLRRLDISMNTIVMSLICDSGVCLILSIIFFNHWDEVPQTVEVGHSLVIEILYILYARLIIARTLRCVRVRDHS